MVIAVKKAGILDTIQDLGRYTFTKFGINPNGAMDRTAVRLLNILLGNSENTPVIECHFPASEFVFESDVAFAVGGADFGPELAGTAIENWRPYCAKADSVLRFTGKRFGNRGYLAIASGITSEDWLNSCSTNLLAGKGGYEGRSLRKGDRIVTLTRDRMFKCGRIRISESLIPFYSSFPTVRIVAGPEYDHLNEESRTTLAAVSFTLTAECDRMGFRLSGETLLLEQHREYISSAVVFGTIQLLPNGQLIVLMADHQTAGGYPRIANVIDNDLPLLAQLGPGDKVAFQLISLEEAEIISRRYERDVNWLRIGSRFSHVVAGKM